MAEPTNKEIIEACAHLMGKDILWLVNQDDPILEANLCDAGMVPWNPLKDSALCFDLMVDCHMRIEYSRIDQIITVRARDYFDSVTVPYGTDRKVAYREAVCMMAFRIWNIQERTIEQLDRMYIEALRVLNELKTKVNPNG